MKGFSSFVGLLLLLHFAGQPALGQVSGATECEYRYYSVITPVNCTLTVEFRSHPWEIDVDFTDCKIGLDVYRWLGANGHCIQGCPLSNPIRPYCHQFVNGGAYAMANSLDDFLSGLIGHTIRTVELGSFGMEGREPFSRYFVDVILHAPVGCYCDYDM